MRKICYISGTRADFGLMEKTLQAVHSHPAMSLVVVVTGMHLSPRYGYTVEAIEQTGLPVAARVEVDDPDHPDGGDMARNIGKMLVGFVDALREIRPDVVLLLGDRGEMLAGAVAAIHLNIPVAHIHGGERSGTVDEPVRHAISRLSHLHFVATPQARDRLVRMGEREDCIWVCGAPGIDGLSELANLDRAQLCEGVGFDPHKPVALLLYHPVLQASSSGAGETRLILDALLSCRFQILALTPNSDAGSDRIRAVLSDYAGHDDVHVVSHLPRREFVSWMAGCDLMIGNSSSGIIEAATFGTPVINIGHRQNLRERNANVIDVMPEPESLARGLQLALETRRSAAVNIYGDGQASRRIVDVLGEHDLPHSLLLKVNAY